MKSHNSSTASDVAGPAAPALTALAGIAATLASADPLEDTAAGLLLSVRDVLDAEECAIWLRAPSGLMRAWGIGARLTSAATVSALLEEGTTADGGATVLAPLSFGAARIGALSVRRSAALTPVERIFLATVADLLAPVLTHAEQSHQLATEVAARTRQIEEQRRFTAKIIDSLPVGLYVVDREYRVHAWNRKRETGMQGISREEAIGRTIFEILHRQPAELLRAEFDDVFATGRIQQFQMESSATGDVRTFRISKIPMRLDDSDVSHVITIGEDVTEWKEAQERFAQAEKLAAIGTLAAGIMHEINNPLATIAACAESMLLRMSGNGGDPAAASPLPAEFGEYLRIIDAEVHRCKHIVDGLLEFSRPKPVTKVPVDVNEVIEKTLFLLKHHARFKKLAVRLELDRALGRVAHGNPEQLIQVFMALLLNAVDAMGEHGTITLRTHRTGDDRADVVAEVADHGHGIGRTELSKVFEPFYTTKPPGRGTGLGLSICYGIIAEHGGRMEVDSTPGKGSTFRIILPSVETT